METTFKQPDWPFQEPDEVCQTCKPIWKDQGLPYERMEPVYDETGSIMRTENKGIPIVACKYCDGTVLFDLPKGNQLEDNE